MKPVASKTIVFIHGLFQNPESWIPWKGYFESRGYSTHAPAYPFHEGKPEDLRKSIPPGLGRITLGDVIARLAEFIGSLPERPVLIGHSMGGLIAQSLLQKDVAEAAVAVDPAPPKGIFTFKWSFLRANLPTINPLKGDRPCLPSVRWFHYAFCNTMSMEETKIEYDRFVVPESRNIPRSSTRKDGAVDFKRPHRPLLIIAGEKDHIIPASLVRKNFRAYRDTASTTDFMEFPARTHYICGQKGWEEVAAAILGWLSGARTGLA